MHKVKRKYVNRCVNFIKKTFDPLHLAYLAGIIDGEGCFFIGKLPRKEGDGYVNDHYRGLLKICTTDKPLLDWLIEVFDGTQSAATKYQPKAQISRMVYNWNVTGERLLDICHQVFPYLVIKKKQCEIMIKFRNTYTERIGNTKIKPENLDIRAQCLIDIRQINSRFHNHPYKKHNNLNPSALSPVS